MPKKAKDPGHPFPVPEWWWERASEIRDSMTDPAFIATIKKFTGRTYTKFQITRYFQEEKPSTTLELTRDIWLAFRKSHRLPRPFAIAHTPEDAEALDARLRTELDADAAEMSSDLRESPSVSQPSPIDSSRESRARAEGKTVGRGGSASRRGP